MPDLAAAAADLTATVELTWAPTQASRLGEWDYEITFSREGPPYVELIAGPRDSPWDCSGGPRMHHVGWWTADVEKHRDGLDARGARTVFDGCAFGRRFSYHAVESAGLLVELVDVANQEAWRGAWAPGSSPMDTLDEP